MRACFTAMLFVSLGLLTMQAGQLMNSERQPFDSASTLVATRNQQTATRRKLEARWAMRRSQVSLNRVERLSQIPSAEGTNTPSQSSVHAYGIGSASLPVALNVVDQKDTTQREVSNTLTQTSAGCAAERRPYHTILTSSSGTYQAWQCRIMYHHFKLQKARASASNSVEERLNCAHQITGMHRAPHTR